MITPIHIAESQKAATVTTDFADRVPQEAGVHNRPANSRTPLRIGYDTLAENPFSPSSAINYLKSVLLALIEVGPEHEYFVFVSPKNRHLFHIDAPNVHFVDCFF